MRPFELMPHPPLSSRFLGAAVAAFAGLAVALVATGAATATSPGRNGLIAFASDRDPLLQHPQIFSLRIRGGQPRNLSRSAADDYDPAPSPDGRRIAFSRDGEIWLMNADGSRQRLLARGGSHPVWSPDGRTIAYNGVGPGECPPGAYRCGHLVAVWTVRLDGSARRLLETGSRNASWSPSGRRIAYEGAVDPYGGANGIRVANADGTHARWVARAGARPSWAPSGRLIAYVVNARDGEPRIQVVRADGTARRRLAAGTLPIWASRGNRLAYQCGRRVDASAGGTASALCVVDTRGEHRRVVARGVVLGAGVSSETTGAVWSPRALELAYAGSKGIFVVGADGRGRRRVARTARRIAISSLSWSAKGPRLVFTETIPQNDLEIYTVAADGSGVKRLTRNDVDDLQPSWAPDGRRLAVVRLTAARPARPDIWVMNADGSGQRLITRNGVEPSWTSDGSRIVFTRFGPEPGSTFSVTVSTGREQLLVSGGFHGAPSPDGTKLAFVRGSIEDYHVFIAAADGSGETSLARGGGPLSWSPDSTTLLFSGCARGSVCTVRADGSGVRQIPIAEPWGGAYSYSPDGTALTFSSGTGYPTSQIEASGVDALGRRVITAALGRNADPDWQPLRA